MVQAAAIQATLLNCFSAPPGQPPIGAEGNATAAPWYQTVYQQAAYDSSQQQPYLSGYQTQSGYAPQYTQPAQSYK